MKKRVLRKWIRIAGLSLLLIILVLAVVAYRFISPKSDEQVLRAFEDSTHQPHIRWMDFQGKQVRVIEMQAELDTLLSSLVFIHGSPGSSLDFKRYLMDQDLNERFNLIAYDRIGYNYENAGTPLNSVEEEVALLHAVLEGYDIDKTYLLGYSYGGTVAMASPLDYRKKVALAAAVKGGLEPMFPVLKLYEWNLTRQLLPGVVQAAAEEKMRHVEELRSDARWLQSGSSVLAIHGKEDLIVPYQNSVYLADLLGDRLELVSLEEGDHALIWTDYELIKELLMQKLDEQ